MTHFSANLGFLWTELPLPDAIRAAARAGFAAVECHFPYVVDPAEVIAALAETGLPMLGLNTIRGKTGDNGLAAIPGREDEVRAAIAQAVDYAAAIGARNVHVMAGIAEGPEAHSTFLANLRHACDLAAKANVPGLLIEPLNRHDAPGYFLRTSGQARAIIDEIADPRLRLMFDCYHTQVTEGDVTRRMTELLPIIGHVQIAGAPSRAEPDEGELDYRHVLAALDALGWNTPVGAEYRPRGTTEAGLGWMKSLTGESAGRD
jgi:hydroxypyruvate isomerase